MYPIGSMYIMYGSIFTYIYFENQQNVGNCTMHRSYGYVMK